MIDKSAGVKVSATMIATKTPPAPARPIWVRKSMRTIDSAARAMTTVLPAKKTAEPAVPMARRIEATTRMPSSIWRRCLSTIKSE